MSDLGKAEFVDADITDASFEFISGHYMQFVDSRITRSNFNRANLQNAEYENSTLSEVKFLGAILTEANFRDAKMSKEGKPREIRAYTKSSATARKNG